MIKNPIKIILITILTISITICSCTISDFSKEYTGAIVYSKNSNKLHRLKCGEAQKIKTENYVISTKSVVELMNDGYEPCRVCLYYYFNSENSAKSILDTDTPTDELTSTLSDMNISIDSYNDFLNILKSEFNFAPNGETNNNILKMLADLDAVNLFNIYNECDESLFDLLPKYYNGVNENALNRAYEFNNNIGIETLAKYRKKYCESLLKRYDEKTIEYMNRINYYDNFMWHIINNDQTFTPCKYRFYTEYIGTVDDTFKNAIEKSYLEWEDIYNAIFN